MAGSRPFHPALIAVFPVLAVYSANTGLFPVHDIIRPIFAALVCGLALWMIASLAFRSLEMGAWIATCALVGFWSFASVAGWIALLDWFGWIYVVLFAGIGYYWGRRSDPPTALANRFSLILIAVAVVSIFLKSGGAAIAGGSANKVAKVKPDIVFLQVDGYGRADQLRRVMGFDNSAFVDELEKRGFFVAAKSHSNYCQTALSLAATLNLKPIQELIPDGTDNHGVISEFVDRPEVVKLLRSAGYDSIAVSTGFPSFVFQGFDLVYREDEGMTYFEATLLQLTPVRGAPSLGTSQFLQRQRNLTYAFEQMRKLGQRTSRPRFVFAHILAPHPPFVFGADGKALPLKGPFGYWDGSEYMANAGTPQSYRDGYIGQLQWLNLELLSVIDSLSSETIVIVQSDHGSKLHLDQESIAKTDLDEAFGILAAYRLPKGIDLNLSDQVTPLAGFGAVMQKVLGSSIPGLSERSFYSPFSKPTEFTDVTEKLN